MPRLITESAYHVISEPEVVTGKVHREQLAVVGCAIMKLRKVAVRSRGEGIMKSNRTILAVAVFLAAFSPVCVIGQAPGSDEPRNSISADLLWPGGCLISALRHQYVGIWLTFDYQRVLFDHLVLSVRPGPWISPDGYSLRLDLELDIHPFDRGLGGLFFGPALGTRWGSDNSVLLTAGVDIGYQLVLWSRLVLTAALEDGLFYYPTVVGPVPIRATLEIGYAF
jgi:hypothetical protein